MKIKGFLYLIISHLLVASGSAYGNKQSISRSSFPAGFVFGAASSAYQYEGAAAEGGRKPSIWDTFTQKFPDKIMDHSNGSVANDQYHKYKEDVGILKDLGFDAYKFSISWSRVLPSGRLSGGVNQEGINYYNNVINQLLSKGIKPFVTLFHWDLPQALEDEYKGFLSSEIVDDFRDYAELCFRKFGDRVKHWISFNEPYVFATGGYAVGSFAPGRCSDSAKCTAGDSSTEPYLVAHYQLLAHAAAVQAYREKYQKSQNGEIGISINSAWILPYSSSRKDKSAALRALAFQYDWFMEPLKSGSYPKEMVIQVNQRLPKFSDEESKMVKGSFDFIGLNYYTSSYAADVPCLTKNFSSTTDACANLTSERNGAPIGPRASVWLYVYPRGIEQLLLYTKHKFNDPVIYITENGVPDPDNTAGSLFLDDKSRIDYFNSHLTFIHKAIRHGVKVKGYMAWSLLDNFEWAFGYTSRFGFSPCRL